MSEREYIWTSTSTVDDRTIFKCTKNILSHPNTSSPEDLYTMGQMLEMFRRGYREGKDMSFIKLLQTKTAPYSILKNMAVGDSILFPFEKWNSARTAASILKKQFGTKFLVNKVMTTNKTINIRVTRYS